MLAYAGMESYRFSMPKRQIIGLFFGLSLALVVAGAAGGAFAFLWVFPLSPALPLWMAVAAADVLLARSGFPFTEKARLFLWCAGLQYFTASQGAPEVGLVLVAGSAALWASSRRGRGFLLGVGSTALVLFLLGHDDSLLHPGMLERLHSFRFSVHLVSGFALFRMLSWAVAAGPRGEKPSFFDTMEYFLSPAFWLSPMHAAHLVFDHLRPGHTPATRSLLWVLRGFLHAFLFSVVTAALLPWLEARYRSGLSSFLWWELVLLGPALFLISYLEKSRVSYVVAGLLSLSGRSITPDFRAPWAARSLPEYWRRFHYWVWEYYIDYVYMPASVALSRRMSPRAAALTALFLTFSIGTSLIHWVHYPAPFGAALALGTLFGALTLLHGLLGARLSESRLAIPITWLSVFFLYALAYPVYGLGWGAAELVAFFRN